MKNFWNKLNKPIYALAPMAGITDSAFRQICKEFGADVLYSEMASVNALVYNPKKTLEMLYFTKKEHPYIVQLFGSDPENFRKAVKVLLCHQSKNPKYEILNPKFIDGIDINLGCPVKKILKQNAGAALMANLKLAHEVIKATVESTDLPVSVKIRSRSDKVDALRFLDYMSDLDIKSVMIHGRTLNQGFSGSMDLSIIKKARDYFGGVIIANGGINTPEDAQRVLRETGADGIGIARGAIGKPWIFKEVKSQKSKVKNNEYFIKKIILKHAKLVDKIKGEKGIIEMRVHLCAYAKSLPGAKKLRSEMVKVKSVDDIKQILKSQSAYTRL